MFLVAVINPLTVLGLAIIGLMLGGVLMWAGRKMNESESSNE